jgi:hypothetical protein
LRFLTLTLFPGFTFSSSYHSSIVKVLYSSSLESKIRCRNPTSAHLTDKPLALVSDAIGAV